MSRRTVLLLCAVGLASLPGPGCQCGCNHQATEKDGAVVPLDGRPDAATDADLDGGRPDAWPPRDACDATTIELPPSGLTPILQVTNMGRYVAYDEMRTGNEMAAEIFIYDLETCTEYNATFRKEGQYTPSIWGDKVMFSDRVDGSSPGKVELALFDICHDPPGLAGKFDKAPSGSGRRSGPVRESIAAAKS